MHEVYKRATPAERRSGWISLIQAWRASGLTAKIFCEQSGIRLADLRRWSYRLSKRKEAPTKAAASMPSKSLLEFIPLQLERPPSSTTTSDSMDLFVGAHYRLRFSYDIEESVLVRVLNVLQKMSLC